ncbi:hypothetical protein ATO67_07495 [Agrobacterium bohemicum]|uniref:Uncharacterized protein n=1 Tax=Agrobacterium bohemicum TaxID=2052828 RepID=A0A135P1Y1_9HYPH|nr:hypothetical protein ATO67_07495 [Agrobacterium bohemicum]
MKLAQSEAFHHSLLAKIQLLGIRECKYFLMVPGETLLPCRRTYLQILCDQICVACFRHIALAPPELSFFALLLEGPKMGNKKGKGASLVKTLTKFLCGQCARSQIGIGTFLARLRTKLYRRLLFVFQNSSDHQALQEHRLRFYFRNPQLHIRFRLK